MEEKARPVHKILAVLLWALTLFGGMISIYALQFITVSLYASLVLRDLSNATPMNLATSDAFRIGTILVAGLAYIIFMVATSEYHFKHLGERASWMLLAKTVAVEAAIIVIAEILGPIRW